MTSAHSRPPDVPTQFSARLAFDSRHRRRQLRRVGRVAHLDGVTDDDAVVVVGDLGFVAELDRLA
ncbi:hypothetical protein I552_2126 [Mycobacterium xenopi 3993]|nr:hypothetical protein I552_2126 [Mycobacterium xenopi 3993]